VKNSCAAENRNALVMAAVKVLLGDRTVSSQAPLKRNETSSCETLMTLVSEFWISETAVAFGSISN